MTRGHSLKSVTDPSYDLARRSRSAQISREPDPTGSVALAIGSA